MLIDNISLANTIGIENIVMVVPRGIPGAWMSITYHTKNSAGVLADADVTTILVKDPTDTSRIAYNSVYLVKQSTGKYRYSFLIPVIVVEGDWYAEITVTIGEVTGVAVAHFEVSKT